MEYYHWDYRLPFQIGVERLFTTNIFIYSCWAWGKSPDNVAESANRKGNLLISKHRRGDEGIYGLSPGLVRFLNEFVIAKLYP